MSVNKVALSPSAVSKVKSWESVVHPKWYSTLYSASSKVVHYIGYNVPFGTQPVFPRQSVVRMGPPRRTSQSKWMLEENLMVDLICSCIKMRRSSSA